MQRISRAGPALAGLLSLALCAGAAAQESGPGTSADALIQQGLATLHQIDEDHGAALWEDAAPTMKARFPQGEFAAKLRQARTTVGAVSRRTWASVNRVQELQNSAPDLPAGLYANIDYSTHLADGRTVFELVSFRLEPDGRWHLTGYAPRQSQ